MLPRPAARSIIFLRPALLRRVRRARGPELYDMDDKKPMQIRIRIFGIVQGVGFRPFTARLADSLGVNGQVCNKGPFVEIKAQGPEETLGRFTRALRERAPERSVILRIETCAEQPEDFDGFTIEESAHESGEVFVSPDIAICGKCRAELFDPDDRRYLHPFINCTACGPRLTILDSMPYDRARTSMGKFDMCPDCAREYASPESRRYHAQPVCCNDCGPKLYIPGTDIQGAQALTRVRQVLRGGGIAAVKGIGGFHLCCDARSDEAVAGLRRLKSRPFKPFAVMLRDIETVRRECIPGSAELKLLDGPQKPIILLKKAPGGLISGLAAPGNPRIGVMLPYAPVQLLLFGWPDGCEMTDCLIMTSGNASGAPICRDDAEAQKELGSMCDVILSNDRPIHLRADDSVTTFFRGAPYMLRRSRGYAPLPVSLPGAGSTPGEPVLAVGGELKNTFCLASGGLAYLSPYIGDLADMRTVRALAGAVPRMEKLLGISPVSVACDLHPGYNSTAFAKSLGLPVTGVQHHFAHILSCMVENGQEDEVIGAAFDGTGYGEDGTVWGGEFLRVSYSGFTRLGSLEPFLQAGGDAAVREGWRPAVALLAGAFGGEEGARIALELGLCTQAQLTAQLAMLRTGVNCVVSTSAGRLFDAVSAILSIRRSSTYEGEASCALEYAADPAAGWGRAPQISTKDGGRFIIKTGDIIRAMAEGAVSGGSAARLAGQFHSAAAAMTAAGCEECRRLTGINTVALSGGVFQNMLFLGKCVSLLEADGFRVLTHSLVPPNDGGIALGQAAYAAARQIRR
jgi:hydrogenase maturation protein HypF